MSTESFIVSGIDSTNYANAHAAHETICASMLGPKAENHQKLREMFSRVVNKIFESRSKFYPEDPTFINEAIIESEPFEDQMIKLDRFFYAINKHLADHSVPFFSPRYNAHMNTDTSMPATIGYLLGMLWNQNNVTPEAGPLSSIMEFEVGQQLCEMFGYKPNPDRFYLNDEVREPRSEDNGPYAWGHITCGGTIANLESMWVARNLKFYPLSFLLAITEAEGKLKFIAPDFNVKLCDDTEQRYTECSVWQLLNLDVDAVLDLPYRVSKQYRVTIEYVHSAVKPFLIQQTGKDYLEKRFKIENSPVYFVSVTNHYSWPKSCSITGIGIDRLVEIGIDENARLDSEALDIQLKKHLDNKTPVYAVVSILGSTEHGAVDPLGAIVRLRAEYQKKGLSFYIHVDGAWGGYFASLLNLRPPTDNNISSFPPNPTPANRVLQQPLSPYTQEQFEYLRLADSITVDPHKAGFIPYPAGSLCYRNERLRFLVTTSAPYINTTTTNENMGTYGLEGSKPGASPIAVYFSHAIIGLNQNGYGSLLGQASFTAVRMFCNWATLSLHDDKPDDEESSEHRHRLNIVPFIKLPSEKKEGSLVPWFSKEVEEERKFIQENIVECSNDEIVRNPAALEKIRKLGSDLIINVFACNFYVDGRLNTDVDEANYLNKCLYDKLSIRKVTDKTDSCEVILGSSVFPQSKYGDALKQYKDRLGLVGDGDLTIITSTSMSPFPTAHNFVKYLARIVERTVKVDLLPKCYRRIQVKEEYHGFIMQGTETLHLAYLPMFNVGSYRQQLIITGKLQPEAMKEYVKERRADPSQLFVLHTERAYLEKILRDGRCKVSIHKGLPELVHMGAEHLLKDVELTDIKVVLKKSLAPASLQRSYPEFMKFYVYGHLEEYHIDHVLTHSPNTQLTASNVEISLRGATVPNMPKVPEPGIVYAIAVAKTIREAAMQPFNALNEPDFFERNKSFDVDLYMPDGPLDKNVDISKLADLEKLFGPSIPAKITLKDDVFVDYTFINQDENRSASISPRKQTRATLGGESVAKEIQSIASVALKKFKHAVVIEDDMLDRVVSDVTAEERYVITAGCGEGEEDIGGVLSRYVIREPIDEHSRDLLIHQGWRDEIQGLVKHSLRPVA